MTRRLECDVCYEGYDHQEDEMIMMDYLSNDTATCPYCSSVYKGGKGDYFCSCGHYFQEWESLEEIL